MAEPESLNAAVAGYVPNAGDVRRQVAHDKMLAYIRIVVDQAPPLSAEQISLLRGLLSGPKPDPSRFRRWQVKLSCGHEVSTESLDDNPPRHALDCPECGAADRIVVAFQPVNPSGEPQQHTTTPHTPCATPPR